jgi:ribosomal protein L16 Arg81 hydroxylase
MLETLLKPLTPDRFFTDYWPDRTYASHGKLSRLPTLFRSDVLTDFSSLARKYRGRLLITRGRNSPYMVPADSRSAEALFRMGLTVYMDDIAPLLPDAGRSLAILEQDLGIAPGTARIGAFASPTTDGVAPHYDVEDVISVQLQGTKKFHVAPVDEIRYPAGMQYSPGDSPEASLYPQTRGRFPDWQGVNFKCVEMRPGSVLFMPRGTWHKTEAEGPSLAVSIILKPPPAVDTVLEQLRWLLLQKPEWRKPLYGAWGNGTRHESALNELGELLGRLPELAGRLDHAALELALAPEGTRLERIGPVSRFRRQPNARVEVTGAENGGEASTVRVLVNSDDSGEQATVRIEVHPQAAEVFEWLGAREEIFTLNEMLERFPAFPLDQHIMIAQNCAKARLLQLIWFPEV